ncbi:hypothetical protein [Streptomyces sp. SID3212]|uniref:hypothetical protein n=1 Tax=Streptomyces sp. SID3212 TaxID=2690259 RepID=UPI001369AA67|nr:hypothetical protein [Streptomyces sp. SID3212]MYV58021.1 hypothetical protein [Streptomyces sp. SID3212]
MSTPIEEIDTMRYLGAIITQGANHWTAYNYAVEQATNAGDQIPAAQTALLAFDSGIRTAEAALHTALVAVPMDLPTVFAAAQSLDVVFAEVRPFFEAFTGLSLYAQEQSTEAANRATAIADLLPEIRQAIRNAYAALPPEE